MRLDFQGMKNRLRRHEVRIEKVNGRSYNINYDLRVRFGRVTGMNTTLRVISFLLFMVAASFRLFAGEDRPPNLGSGEPGLKIVFAYNSTNQFAIYLDEPWTVGPGLIGGYDKRHIEVLLDHSYGLKEKLQSRTERMDIPEQLYPFDDESVFTCKGDAKFPNDRTYKTNSMGESISDDGKTLGFPRVTAVFSTNADRILVSDDVYALARSRYGLTTNQLFLGKIGTNVFYWEARDSATVYYHAADEAHTTNYFKLPKGVIDVFGVAKAVSTNKNVGFDLLRKSGWFSYSPNEFLFTEVSFKDARQVKSNQ